MLVELGDPAALAAAPPARLVRPGPSVELVESFALPPLFAVASCAVVGHEGSLLLGSADGRLLWLEDGEGLDAVDLGFAQGIVSVSASGDVAVCAGLDAQADVAILRYDTGAACWQVAATCTDAQCALIARVACVASSAQARPARCLVARLDDAPDVAVVDVARAVTVQRWPGHRRLVADVCVGDSPEQGAVSCAADGRVLVYDARAPTPAAVLEPRGCGLYAGPAPELTSVACCGTTIVAVSLQGDCFAMDLRTGPGCFAHQRLPAVCTRVAAWRAPGAVAGVRCGVTTARGVCATDLREVGGPAGEGALFDLCRADQRCFAVGEHGMVAAALFD